jgi:hypothetical protein
MQVMAVMPAETRKAFDMKEGDTVAGLVGAPARADEGSRMVDALIQKRRLDQLE